MHVKQEKREGWGERERETDREREREAILAQGRECSKCRPRVQTLQTRGEGCEKPLLRAPALGAAPPFKVIGKCADLRFYSFLARTGEYVEFGPVRQPQLGERGTLCTALTRACASLHTTFETGASRRKFIGSYRITRQSP